MPNRSAQLPVEQVLPDIAKLLATSRTVILQAPPGSGKTTRVPLALLDAPWLGNSRILMLEPRRLAATNAARYMASLKQEKVGETVGYAIRYERKTSPATRLEVMTEGLLNRRLQSNPELSGVGLVIFDEFHERTLQADLALALCRDIQQGLRDDLRILVMSATLDASPLAKLLDHCPIVSTSGRTYPVAVEYLGSSDQNQIASSTAEGVRRALKTSTGDILAFLPGSGEIHRCANLLGDLTPEIAVRPLFGNMPFAEQEAAILPGAQRRVVLATNVAETSLTIEGITTVVDSGWERRPGFDAARGMPLLQTVRISRASAEQRAGRAGRLGPGRCLRLWPESLQNSLLPFAPAEIRTADLAPLAFDLACWGISKVDTLTWLDPPPEGHLTAARRLLIELGVLDKNYRQTALGRAIAEYPTHPRLACLLVKAISMQCPGLGSDLVALLSERDLLSPQSRQKNVRGASDLLERLTILRRDRTPRTAAVRRAAAYWRALSQAGQEAAPDTESISRLLASAYPDRIGLSRSPGSRRYLLRNGQGVTLAEESVLYNEEWLVAVETAGRKDQEGEIRLASAISRTVVEELFGQDLAWQRESGWDSSANRVFAKEVRRLGAIVLQERPLATTPADTVPALLALIRQQGLKILPWTQECRQLRARASFLHRHLAEQGWKDWAESTLLNELEEWLQASLLAVKNRSGLANIDLEAALKARLGWRQLAELDSLAPEKLSVPSGSKVRVNYTDNEQPVLAVKLQEMFGLADTPHLAKGRVPVLIHLLSPAGRPVAVTSDLRSFWNNIYPDVQKELRGRYPKHPWPDDPWSAPATKKTKKRMN